MARFSQVKTFLEKDLVSIMGQTVKLKELLLKDSQVKKSKRISQIKEMISKIEKGKDKLMFKMKAALSKK